MKTIRLRYKGQSANAV